MQVLLHVGSQSCLSFESPHPKPTSNFCHFPHSIGVFLPSQSCFRVCVFCKHSFIDEGPNNKNVLEKTRAKETAYNKLKAEFEAFKNGKRNDPPIRVNGKPVTKRMPPLNRESFILQCHCFQMRCTREGSDIGSTCELKCCNPVSGERYEWVIENEVKKCNCPVCCCRCRKAYKQENIHHIMAEIAKQSATIDKNGNKIGLKEQEKCSLEAQDFIASSIQYGYDREVQYRVSVLARLETPF